MAASICINGSSCVPYSKPYFDDQVAGLIKKLRPATICDIGVGAGKYGKMIRTLMADETFSTKLTGIELDLSYVEKFDLRKYYDELVIGPAIDLLKNVYRRFDLVIIGDCIEHMRKSEGVDLLNFLIYRSAYIMVIYPEAFRQDDWDGAHIQEAHISTWGPSDFANWEYLHLTHRKVHFYLLRGYEDSSMELSDIKTFLRAGHINPAA